MQPRASTATTPTRQLQTKKQETSSRVKGHMSSEMTRNSDTNNANTSTDKVAKVVSGSIEKTAKPGDPT